MRMCHVVAGIFLLGISSITTALDFQPDGVAISYGQYHPVVKNRDADFNKYRLSVIWDIKKGFYQSDSIQLDSYFEVAGSRWKSQLSKADSPSPDGKGNINVFSFSPILRLTSNGSVWGGVSPFLDMGAGAAWLSEVDLEKKKKSPINMGGHWQFELRLMPGIRFGDSNQFELSYGWYHYSNAHINSQNESIDFQVLTFGYKW